MKCHVPQICWHSRDPVLSIDFQPIQGDVLRLASGGTDSHILIWYITYQENNYVKLECASDLYRHNKSVNVVRFSPNGEFLASGDDEGAMFIWELREREQMLEPQNDDENINKEDWYPVKSLRGHLDDIYDICWSKDGNFLVSSSMDNTVIIWDMQKHSKVHIFSDFKGYVQGVSWDPLNQFIASVGSDRSLRIHNVNTKKIVYKISKAPWTNSTEKGTFKARLFYDDTLQSYFRRLTFTPDGELLIVPSGILEKGEKVNNTCYIFSRHALNKPVISLPTGDKYTVAVRCNPFLYKLRTEHDVSDEENLSAKPMINLPYRMIFAVAACDSVLLYDTEQILPFAYVSNIHYTHLTDLSWSPDGLTLVVSSTDGYCSFLLFTRKELGEIYVPEKAQDIEKDSNHIVETNKNEKMDVRESPVVTCPTDTEIKNASAPNTPRRITPIPVKSPKLVSGTKEDNTTSLSKVKSSTDNKKISKKSPKMCSIKKFFISPKAAASTSVSDETNKTSQSYSVSKDTAVTSADVEVIELSDSPLKIRKTSLRNTDNTSKQIKDKNSELQTHTTEEAEAMDIDNNPAGKIISGKVQASPNSGSSEKQSMCKKCLDFADKDELLANIDDNASDSNPVPFESAADDDKQELKPVAENDWKLELSQDEEPMEIAPTVPDSKSDVPKVFSLGDMSKKEEFGVSKIKTEIQNPPENKQKPKRRVQFITLSSKKK